MRSVDSWQSKLLGDLVLVDLESLPENTERDFPFSYIDISSVSEGKITLPPSRTSFGEAPSRARRIVHRRDVLMSTVRPNLKAFAYFDHTDENCVASTGFAVLTARPEIDPKFVLYTILSEAVAAQIEAYVAGSNYPAIASSAVRCLRILVPPFAEQTKIAEILSTVDQAIEQTEALTAKQQSIKTGLIEDLLTRGIDEHGSLRSEETHQFKDSRLGRIPVEWDVVQLGSVSEIGSGLTLGNTYSGRNTVELPYLRVANVQDGYLDLADVRTVQVPESDVRKYQLEVGDVLMNEGGDFDKLGRGSVWNGEIENCLHQNHVFRVRPMPGKLAPGYLSAVSASPYGKSFFILASKQSTNLASINSTQLKSFPIPLPEYGEQLRIEGVVRQSASTQEETGKQLRKLRSLKAALMQDLLKGRVRVTALLSDSEVMG